MVGDDYRAFIPRKQRLRDLADVSECNIRHGAWRYPTREMMADFLAPMIVAACRSVLNTPSPARNFGENCSEIRPYLSTTYAYRHEAYERDVHYHNHHVPPEIKSRQREIKRLRKLLTEATEKREFYFGQMWPRTRFFQWNEKWKARKKELSAAEDALARAIARLEF